MDVMVSFSTPLLKMTGGERNVLVDSDSIEGLLQDLAYRFPALIKTICDGEGKIRSMVSIYVNDLDIRFLDGLDTKLTKGDEVYFIPTIAGG